MNGDRVARRRDGLARGSLAARGVHPPESCIDPEEMFAELRLRGCEFDVSVDDAQEAAR